MSNEPGPTVIDRFRERVAQRRWGDVKVTYRVAGGMPSEGRVEEELQISGQKAAARDLAGGRERSEGETELDDAQAAELLTQLAGEIDGMVAPGQARFVPDSVVGAITIEVDGQFVTRFFLADEEERRFKMRGMRLADGDVIGRFAALTQRLLGKEGR